MSISATQKLTHEQQAFLVPKNATHRQYEALRAYFVEGLPSQQAAQRFGYTSGSFRVLCAEFRKDLDRSFFTSPNAPPPGHKPLPKTVALREQVIAMRKQNLSVYDIARLLEEQGNPLGIETIAIILREEGFARLPRRSDEERAGAGQLQPLQPDRAATADVRLFDQILTSSSTLPHHFHTQFGGIFL